MTWHRRPSHPWFKTVVELAWSGTCRMTITGLLVRNPGLGACAVCVAEKSVHLLDKDVDGWASIPSQVHIDISGPMPVALVRGRGCVYVVVDGYTCAVDTRPLRLKSGQSKR